MRKQLGELELADFDEVKIWAAAIDACDDEDLEPRPGKFSVGLDESGLWVRVRATCADGSTFAGIAMADSHPPYLLALSFEVSGEWVGLVPPGAPDFVLAAEGPAVFSDQLGKPLKAVFPLRIESEVTDHEGRTLKRTVEATGA